MKMIRSTSSTSISGVTFIVRTGVGTSPVDDAFGAVVFMACAITVLPCAARGFLRSVMERDVLDLRPAEGVTSRHMAPTAVLSPFR